MPKWKIYTPEGVQDILFEDCFLKRDLEYKLRNLFRSSGFYEIETPTLEFYDTFSADGDLTPQETMFKFFDPQGRILVLRPDATIPVARVAATKLKDVEYPLKVSYIGNTFRYNELGGGRQKEFTQAGIEILGVNTAEADAEVIATAAAAMKAVGIENFQIDIGQVDFFKGIMEQTGLSDEDTEQMRVLIDKKDFIGIEELVEKYNISADLKNLILDLPRLFGPVGIIDSVEKRTDNARSIAALQNLRKVLQILDDYELSEYISIDLGMVQSLNYYTGIVFRGFTYGVGFPVISGGRYDNLVEKFGKRCSATGFSMGVNLLMIALEKQKIEVKKPGVQTLVCYDKDSRKIAFKLCEELRNQGMSVEMDVSGKNLEEIKKYAKNRKTGGIMFVRNGGEIELYDVNTGKTTVTSIEELENK
ncbi:MAG TPA: ATP phosphoribosyltransferase regulatory subunit [Clostridiaceae bacterium]|nr:ATP phosphoribosyltransferase regulatory subunit [Clostridiaceae bacterium]